jgi:hypothetical protein
LTKILYSFPISPVCAAGSTHLIRILESR